MYKVADGPRGRKLYFRSVNGKFKMISVKSIPTEIVEQLQTHPEVSEDSDIQLDVTVEPSDEVKLEIETARQPKRLCLFCGQHAKLPRLVNLQTIYVCDTHYYEKTVGQIAQKLREIDSETHQEADEKEPENANEAHDEGKNAPERYEEGLLVVAP